MRLTCLSRFLFIASLSLLAGRAQAQSVVVSEIMAAGQNVLTDEDGERPDWIELHNTGAAAANLNGWFLSDDSAVPQKWAIQGLSIPANGFAVIFASGKNRTGGELHTNFQLGSGGESVVLSRPNGTAVDTMAFPAQLQNISFGRAGAELRYFQSPTPEAENGAVYLDIAASPKFNRRHGFQTAPFSLVMTTETPGATIRYTLDGTEPSATNGSDYTAPLAINKTTVVRAAAVKADFIASPITTASYLYTADIIRQSPNGETPAGGWPAPPQEKFGLNYGMDPEIVDSPLYRDTIQRDLQTIPTLSLVCDLASLYDNATGIWANPYEQGVEWERPMSLELIETDGGNGFTQPGGMRIRGGASRDSNNPKHSFRFFFRGKYGDDDLDGKFFGEDGANRFDKFDLRTDQIVSWHLSRDASTRFIQDQFLRDTVRLAGFPSTRGDFYHLYINGQYWGMYNTEERAESSWAATYFGGKPEDYDVLNKGQATQGDIEGWSRAIELAKRGLSSNAAYQKIQGLNPDGTRNPQFEPLVDVDSLIMYMTVGTWLGVHDTPADHGTQNNWYQVKSRLGNFGMRFISHDTEISMSDVEAVFVDRLPNRNPFDGLEPESATPWHMWEAMRANSEFRLRVADYVHRFYFNDGLMTPDNAKARWQALMDRIDRAVVGESARWGDFASWGGFPGPFVGGAAELENYTRATWLAACDRILNEYLPQRHEVMLKQFREAGLYPTTAAPVFNQFGGKFQPGATVTLTNPGGQGTIYYTTDGSDPRKIGGAVSATARAFSSPIALNASVTISARVKNGAAWSALARADFVPAQDVSGLRLTEIHYNPPAVGAVSGDEYEFIELHNAGTTPVDLGGFRFLAGIEFVFPAKTTLAPGAYFVLARNAARFAEAHPGVTPRGIYTGKLDNGGEDITLVATNGAVVLDLSYNDNAPWPLVADGFGFSIVHLGGDLDEGANWRASAQAGGSPGAADPAPNHPQIFVNEVRTRSATTQPDAIELFNNGSVQADISGWWISDDSAVPKKFRVPAGSVIPAGGHLVFNEAQFNPTPGAGGNSFGLDAAGDSVWIFSASAAGDLTGYSHGFKFAASEPDVTFGRVVNTENRELFVAQSSATLGAANAGPRVPELQLTEIHYQPNPGSEANDEFIELGNTTPGALSLDGWKIAGLDFDFPAGATLAVGQIAVVSALEPADFRVKYNVPAGVAVFGPAFGVLQNSGERVEVLKPGPAATNGLPSFIVVDAVRYNDRAPWPLSAAGAGPSLQLLPTATFGDEPANWFASGATPGGANVFNASPTVALLAPVNGASFTQPRPILLSADAADSDGTVARVQFFAGDQIIGEATSAPYQATWEFAPTGSHDIVARVTDDKGAVAETNPHVILVQPPGAGIGVGLRGEYFASGDFSGTPVVRVDPQLDFDFGDSPIEGIEQKPYSIRWTGFVRAPRTGEYTVRVRTGMAVTLDLGEAGSASVEEQGAEQEAQVELSISAGQLVPITISAVETADVATLRLLWFGPGLDNTGELISEVALYAPDQDPDALGISTAARLAFARRNTPYSAQLVAVNGVAPYTWTGAGLPAGLALSATGQVSGKPLRPAVEPDATFSATVRDGTGAEVTKQFHLRVLVAATDGPRPQLVVASPQNNVRLGRGVVQFTGTATHARGVESVEFSINNGEWRFAEMSDETHWQVSLDAEQELRPGVNTLSFRASEPHGSQSPVVNRTAQFVLNRFINVSVQGQGTVSGVLLGENIIPAGKKVTLVARPGRGQVFVGWFGLPDGDSQAEKVSFTVSEDATIQANFEPEPSNDRPGTFVGLLGMNGGDPAQRGRLTLKLTPNSRFTAKIERGALQLALKGRFNNSGYYETKLDLGDGESSSLTLSFSFDNPNLIHASVSKGLVVIDDPRRQQLARLAGPGDGDIITLDPPIPPPDFGDNFELRRGHYTTENPCPLSGKITLSFRPNADDEGHGIAKATVSKLGTIRITGYLANGDRLKTSARLDDQLTARLYTTFHKKTGTLSGFVQFDPNQPGNGSGELLWCRPENVNSPAFPALHVASLTAYAAAYNSPKGGSAVLPSLEYAIGIRTFGAAADISGSAILSADNQWTFGGTGLDPAPTFKVDPKTGLATGTIMLPGSTKPIALRGVVNQTDNTVHGFLPIQHNSGAIQIHPNEATP